MNNGRLLRKIQTAAVLGAGMVVVFGGVALAAQHLGVPTSPTTTQQTASFAVAASKTVEKHCTGSDGSYVVTNANYLGTMTGAADARLNGKIRMSLSSLVNATTGDGTTSGTIRWLNAKGNPTASHGSVIGVNTAAALPNQSQTLHGFIAAYIGGVKATKKTKAISAGRLRANFVAAPGSSANSWSGSFGGTSLDNRRPAVIQTGHC